MDDRGNLYENPTDEEVRRLNLIRLPSLKDQFLELEQAQSELAAATGVTATVGPNPMSRRERRKLARSSR